MKRRCQHIQTRLTPRFKIGAAARWQTGPARKDAGRLGMWLGYGLVLCITCGTRADQVVVNKDTYTDARIVGIEDGMLHFRTSHGDLRAVWIDEMDLAVVDRAGGFTDFNQAERFLARDEPEEAITRYRRTLRTADDFWSELVTVRLQMACERAGRLDQSVSYFLRVLRGSGTGSVAASRLIPAAIPSSRTVIVIRALEYLDVALTNETDEARRALVTLARYEILRQSGDERAAEAEVIAMSLPIPTTARSERAFAIKLSAMESQAPIAPWTGLIPAIDDAITTCPKESLPGFLLLKGQLLMARASTREEIIRAAWVFLRIPAHLPRSERTPEALYLAALAIERIGRRDQAVKLLKAGLEHRRIDADMRERTQNALERLQADASASD